MIREYPQLEPNSVSRQGESWLSCDVGTCTAEAKLQNVEQATVGGHTYRYAPMPDGWVTNDPDDNALNGAAQFCDRHANRVVKPEPADDPVVVTEPDPAPEPEPA